MTRRELLHWCLAGCMAGSLVLACRTMSAQEGVGRATLPSSPPTGQPPRGTDPQQVQQTPRVARPQPLTIEVQLPQELEDLLVQWEQKSGKIQRLRGKFERYVYDSVFLVEKWSIGDFWYEAPDQGRMDFKERELPDPPVNTKRVGSNGKPYDIQSDQIQKWVCTGKDVFIIHETEKLYDYIEIPPQQRGRNIINGPLPFLFGMKAEQAKARYQLNLGAMNWPQGKFEADDKGRRVMTHPPQVHIVAVPKLTVDKQEWSRAEVILDGETFLPNAIRLLDPTQRKETVYVFLPRSKMWVNERIWLPNPFHERPPRGFTEESHTRATDEEAAPRTERVLPAAGQKPNR